MARDVEADLFDGRSAGTDNWQAPDDTPPESSPGQRPGTCLPAGRDYSLGRSPRIGPIEDVRALKGRQVENANVAIVARILARLQCMGILKWLGT